LLSAVTLIASGLVAKLVRRDQATALGMIAVAILMLVVDYFIIINGRFRLSRLKEVDTVFDAFFLVQQHQQRCPHCNYELSPDSLSHEQ